VQRKLLPKPLRLSTPHRKEKKERSAKKKRGNFGKAKTFLSGAMKQSDKSEQEKKKRSTAAYNSTPDDVGGKGETRKVAGSGKQSAIISLN